MLYDSYHKKITKLVKSLRILLRCMVVLCIVNVVIFLGIVTFMATKGIVFDSWFVDSKFEITYGEEMPIDSHALFAKIFYEYSEDGEEWSKDAPSSDGDYMVRASAKGIFGNTRHGKTYTYVLNPKEIDVSVSDTQITYGEFPNIEADLVAGDRIVCDEVTYSDLLAKNTDVVPSKKHLKILNADDKDVTKLYDITFVTTQIEILPRDITIDILGAEKVYDSKPLSSDKFEIKSGSLAEGDKVVPSFDKVITDVTGDEGIKNTPAKVTFLTADGMDVGVHYNLNLKIGTLKIIPRKIGIKTNDAEKVYDDTPLINNGYVVQPCPPEINPEDYGLLNPEKHGVLHTIAYGDKVVSITDVGQIGNKLDLRIKDSNGVDKTENYAVQLDYGMLVVTPRPVEISSISGEWVYDGQNHAIEKSLDPVSGELKYETQDKKASITIKGLCAAHEPKLTTLPSIIDVGEVENNVDITGILNAEGKNVISNYEISYGEVGTLTVTKRPITIKHESNQITYDGIEHIFGVYEITSELGLAANDTLDITYPKFSQAGTYTDANKIVEASVSSQRDSGKKTFDISDNYEVTEIFGTIVIDKCKITIEPESNTKVYDGTGLSAVRGSVVEGSLPRGHDLKVTYKTTDVVVGEYDAEIDLDKTTIIFNNVDVKSNFEITVRTIKLTITPRKITLQPDYAKKTYDGTALTSTKYSITSGSLASNQIISQITITGSQTDPGTSANVIDKDSIIILDANNNNVTSNYEITCEDGTLEVVKRKLYLISNSETKQYDATELRGKEVTVDTSYAANDGLLPGHYLEYTLPNSIINVGYVYNEVADLDIIDSNGVSVKDSYYEIVKVTKGKLTITRAPLKITTGTKSKVYDGTSLIYEHYELEGTLYGGDWIEVSVTGEKSPAPGRVYNTASFVVYDKEGNESNNYDVTVTRGTLTITARVIKIEPLPDTTSKEYDGKPLECIGWKDVSDTTNDEGLISGHEIREIIFKSITNAGTLWLDNESVYSSLIVDTNDESRVNDCYQIEVVGGKSLTIIPRPITVTSASARKEYDGRPLTDSNYTVSSGLLTGHSVDVSITGTQTAVGQSNNTIYSVRIYDEYNNNVTSNYKITKVEGILEVYEDIVARVKTNGGRYIYLKAKSYGDYNSLSKEFGPAPIQSYSFAYNSRTNSFMLWASATLRENAYDESTLEFKDVQKYILPYYMTYGGTYTMPTYSSDADDFTKLSTSTQYTVPYYDYSYEAWGTNGFSYLRQINSYSNYNYYRSWVRNNYLTVSSDSSSTVQSIINANGFANNMPIHDRVSAVARYVRSSAAYKVDYPLELDEANDVVYALFNTYQAGSSKHFALSAMMIYRELGIPARYVEGYYVEAEKGVWTDVKIKHSWVEVFIDEYGWMQVEVTPGFGNTDVEKIDITLKPVDCEKVYDGKPLLPKNEVVITDEVQALLDQGYTIEISCDGSQTYVGSSPSTIVSYIIRDKNRVNVTYKFNVKTVEGTLEVTKIPLNVCVYGGSKTYDAKALKLDQYEVLDVTFIQSGYTLEIEFVYAETDVYSITLADIMNAPKFSDYFTFRIMNGDEDITDLYYINLVPDPTGDDNGNEIKAEEYVVAAILKKDITISSDDAEDFYVQGATLSDHDVYVSEGPLAEGHRLVYSAEKMPTLDKVGVIENTIDSASLYIVDDINKREVTHNYNITLNHGKLTFFDQEITSNK